MSTTLPNFPAFKPHVDENSAGLRWKKWLERFENLLVALDISDDKKKKAMLLHYVGEETYDIFDSFTQEQKGVNATRLEGGQQIPNEFEVAKNSLTNYFTPKKNVTYEVFKFRQASQQTNENIDSFYTRLRTLAQTCDFHDQDREILSQIIQGCSSTRVRRKALKESSTLQQVLSEARALELSEQRATEIEHPQQTVVNAIKKRSHSFQNNKSDRSRGGYNSSKRADFHNNRAYNRSAAGTNRNNRGDQNNSSRRGGNNRGDRSNKSSQSNACRYCGYSSTHSSCPAQGKECFSCHKIGHFGRVCESKRIIRHLDTNDNDTYSSDESIFVINTQNSTKHPTVMANIHNTPTTFLIDTGASVNIMNAKTFDNLTNKPNLETASTLIYAFGSDIPLPVIGVFQTDITYKTNTTNASFYVIDSDSKHTKNLLSSQTAQNLNIIKFAFSSTTPSIPPQSLPTEYPQLFDDNMGKIKDVQIKLHIDQSVQPITQRHRRVPFHVRKDVENELKRLENLDVIEKVEGPTPWVSPIVTVPKKTGGVRICVDMREANVAIKREKHPMPTIDELISDLNESTVFSKLDLSNAYHQLELEESSRYITTFSTHLGLMRYKRLIFGVNAAAEIFQKTIADLLNDIPGAKNISDDIIVHGKGQADHDKNLHLTLQRLQEKGAKLKREKCLFSVDKLTFYGHVFSSKGVAADPEKIKTIKECQPPKTVSEVRSFLGMVQYVSRFIPHYATLTEPLRRLTKKDTKWKWTENEMQAFNTLKSMLTSSHVMAYFNKDKHTEIVVDASPVGIGAIMMQDKKVICYASRALTPTEQRYSQTDKEMLAVVYGVEHFHLYLYGSSFSVITDHKPLTGIISSQKPGTARMERWKLRLTPYEMNLQYRPGRNENNPADYISRHPQTQPKKDNAAEEYISYVAKNSIPKAMTQDEVREATQKDGLLNKVMKAIQTGDWNDKEISEYERFKEELSVYKGLILRDHRLIIPSELQRKVIEIAHLSHQGIVKTKQCIREKVWFPGIDKQVEQIVKSCIPCQASYPGPSNRDPILPTILPEEPWVSVSIDFKGPLPSGDYLLVVIDDYSRYPEVEVISSTSSRAVLPKLNQIFSRQGIPTTVRTDNGPPFNSQDFKDFAQQLGFKHRKVMPLWPEANGEVERFMRSLNKALLTSTVQNSNWKKELLTFLLHYRGTPHSSTKISPFEALTGRKMNIGLPSSPLHPLPSPLHTMMKLNDKLSKEKMTHTSKHSPSRLKVGDHVLVKQRRQNKLSPPYDPNPYTITDKKGSMVTAQRGHSRIVRNSSFYKPIQGHIPSHTHRMESDADDDNSVQITDKTQPTHITLKDTHDSPVLTSSPVPIATQPCDTAANSEQTTQECTTPDSNPQSMPLLTQPTAPEVSSRELHNQSSRPIRNRKPPEYLKDYITK